MSYMLKYIGKINVKLFREISQNIITDKVILIDKQRQHIKSRHPGILEKYEKYFSQCVENPDLILKDKTRKNTALVLKTIYEDNLVTINLVIRLAIIGDDSRNKNSIITCIPIGRNRLKSYIKNSKIIYKKE